MSFENSFGASGAICSSPRGQKASEPIRAPGNVLFLGPDGIGIDGGGGELGMAKPFLHQVERDAGAMPRSYASVWEWARCMSNPPSGVTGYG